MPYSEETIAAAAKAMMLAASRPTACSCPPFRHEALAAAAIFETACPVGTAASAIGGVDTRALLRAVDDLGFDQQLRLFTVAGLAILHGRKMATYYGQMVTGDISLKPTFLVTVDPRAVEGLRLLMTSVSNEEGTKAQWSASKL